MGPDDYSEGDWEPDGTGTYEGSDTTITYDVNDGQHVEVTGE
jgi:hypothetical protein